MTPNEQSGGVEPAPGAASAPREPETPAVAKRKAHEPSVIETLQSLIVAFVLAMMFRGFVLEGFVIPTGSMAPTLLGEHALVTSSVTGYTHRVEASSQQTRRLVGEVEHEIADPMIGPHEIVARPSNAELMRLARPGDRILVLKYLYGLFSPKRWDVVVFKNPTRPEQNYIKRLVGLPDETVWLADGDVFVRTAADEATARSASDGGEAGREIDGFTIRRKPEFVQRAVWQPIFDLDFVPADPTALNMPWPPWYGEGWSFHEADRAARHAGNAGGGAAVLRWNNRLRPINDWNPYNLDELTPAAGSEGSFAVSDLRLMTAVTPDADGLAMSFRLITRTHLFEFVLAGSIAEVRYRPVESNDESQFIARKSGTIRPFRAGEVRRVECWHVDQSMKLFVDDELIVELEYEWDAAKRLLLATGSTTGWHASEPDLEWRFENAGVTLHHLRVDRDLYYEPAQLNSIEGPAFGTHPDNFAILGPDHFFMCGDNSPASSDSRKWDPPHPLVKAQIDPTRFVVHRRLLIGKAFFVYFPAPYGLSPDGARFVPDFGNLRFIR